MVARSPVTPMRAAAYTKPRALRATVSRRSVDESGETRKMRSSPWRSEASIHSPASSGIRSGVMRPAPPTFSKSRAKRSTP